MTAVGGGVAPRGRAIVDIDVDERGGAAPAATVVADVTGAVVERFGIVAATTIVVVDVLDRVGAATRRFVGAAPAAKLPTRATVAVRLTTTVAARLRRAA
jgi:hypothetical protein